MGAACRESVTDVLLLSLPAAVLLATPSVSHSVHCPHTTTPSASHSIHCPHTATPSASHSIHCPHTATPSASHSIHCPHTATPSASNSIHCPHTATPSASHSIHCPQRHLRSVTTTNVHSDTFGQSQRDQRNCVWREKTHVWPPYLEHKLKHTSSYPLVGSQQSVQNKQCCLLCDRDI